MPKRLLDRQTELVGYLTSAPAISGRDGGLDLAPAGFDGRFLLLEARLSHEKRMQKVRSIFARTFEFLAPSDQALALEFAADCPPASIGRLENARQFHSFLVARWERQPPEPPYLRDVAACELACAEAAAEVAQSQPAEDWNKGVRRAPGAVLLRCAYAIRAIFEQGPGPTVAAACDTPLAIAMPPGADRPRIFEVAPAVFDLLSALEEFVDPSVLCTGPAAERLLDELVENGLVEMRP
jgi:hypothetical protein